MKTWIKKLQEMDACEPAIEWCKRGGYRTLQEAWEACKNGDRMMWLICKTIKDDADTKPLVLIACESGRLSLPYAKKEDKPILIKTYEIAEAWTRDEATINKVRTAAADAAADAAYAAAYAAYAATDAAAYAAADAAYAAAYAADAAAYAADAAAYAAADAAAYAADAAAYAAAYAAADAAYAAAYAAILSQCADIVRKHYPNAPLV